MKRRLAVVATLGVLMLTVGVTPRLAQAGANGEAKDAYQHGLYPRCIQILVQELKNKPDHQDNIDLIESAIPLYVNAEKSAADAAVQKQNWDDAVASYDHLNTLKTLLGSLPPVPKGRKGPKTPTSFAPMVPDVSADRQLAADKASDTHYQEGAKFEAAGNMRGAAVSYREATQYSPAYKDASDRYSKCREKALVKVAVMPFEDKSGKSYGALGDLLTEQLISVAMASNPEFIQFVTRDFVQQLLQEQNAGQSGSIDPASAPKLGKIAGVHSFVFGKILTIIESYPSQTDENGTNSVTEKTKQGDLVHQCSYALHRREGKVTVQASIQIIDVATGAIKAGEKTEDTEADGATWVTFQGDEVAIPDAIRAQNTGEHPLQTAQELSSKAVNKIGADFAQKLLSRF